MSSACSIPGCERRHDAKGYCSAHYKRWRKGAELNAPVKRVGQDEQRFWDKVQRGEGCWLWQGAPLQTGYGSIRFGGKNQTAHRVSYELHNGLIAAGMQIDHICRTRLCVNPDHLRAVSDAANKQNLGALNARNRSGVRGVSWYAPRNKWFVKATKGGKQFYLGYYTDLREAEKVVVEWRRANMPYSEMDKKKAA
jgi:hypothetical protein